jgi:hypothetical protein
MKIGRKVLSPDFQSRSRSGCETQSGFDDESYPCNPGSEFVNVCMVQAANRIMMDYGATVGEMSDRQIEISSVSTAIPSSSVTATVAVSAVESDQGKSLSGVKSAKDKKSKQMMQEVEGDSDVIVPFFGREVKRLKELGKDILAEERKKEPSVPVSVSTSLVRFEKRLDAGGEGFFPSSSASASSVAIQKKYYNSVPGIKVKSKRENVGTSSAASTVPTGCGPATALTTETVTRVIDTSCHSSSPIVAGFSPLPPVGTSVPSRKVRLDEGEDGWDITASDSIIVFLFNQPGPWWVASIVNSLLKEELSEGVDPAWVYSTVCLSVESLVKLLHKNELLAIRGVKDIKPTGLHRSLHSAILEAKLSIVSPEGEKCLDNSRLEKWSSSDTRFVTDFIFDHPVPWHATRLTLDLERLGCVNGGRGHLFGLVRHVLATLIGLERCNSALSFQPKQVPTQYFLHAQLMRAITESRLGPVVEIPDSTNV